jgi:hypothetical protein
MSEEGPETALFAPALPDDTQANAEPAAVAPVEAATPDAPVMGTGGDAAPEEAPAAPVEAPSPAPEAAPIAEPAPEVAAPALSVADIVTGAEALAHPEVQKVVASLTEEADSLRGRVQAAEDKATNLAEQLAQFAGHHPISHFMQALESAITGELTKLGL